MSDKLRALVLALADAQCDKHRHLPNVKCGFCDLAAAVRAEIAKTEQALGDMTLGAAALEAPAPEKSCATCRRDVNECPFVSWCCSGAFSRWQPRAAEAPEPCPWCGGPTDMAGNCIQHDSCVAAEAPSEPVRKTPCCGYVFNVGDHGPILWNPYNDIVQCHNCGQGFIMHTPGTDAEQQRLDAAAANWLQGHRNRWPDPGPVREIIDHLLGKVGG